MARTWELGARVESLGGIRPWGRGAIAQYTAAAVTVPLTPWPLSSPTLGNGWPIYAAPP